MKIEATMQTFAAPPKPCSWTACAMNGTVALAVPPIRTGFLPRRAVMGELTIDVTKPENGRQTHQRCHRQAIRYGDESGDKTAKQIPG